jgi:hypothetical protein
MKKETDTNRGYVRLSKPVSITALFFMAVAAVSCIVLILEKILLSALTLVALLIIIGFTISVFANAVNQSRLYSKVYLGTIALLGALGISLLGILIAGYILDQTHNHCQSIGGPGSCISATQLAAWAMYNYFVIPTALLCIIAFTIQLTVQQTSKK